MILIFVQCVVYVHYIGKACLADDLFLIVSFIFTSVRFQLAVSVQNPRKYIFRNQLDKC